MNISVKTVTMRLLSSSLLKNLKLNQKSNVLTVKVTMYRKKSRHLLQRQAKNHSLCFEIKRGKTKERFRNRHSVKPSKANITKKQEVYYGKEREETIEKS